MSGILCAYNSSGIDQDLSRYLLALRRLRHRGPDAEGTLLRKTFFLGVEISATGLGKNKQQPVVGDDGKIIVALDGRIHDRESLANSLGIERYLIDATSDAQLLLRAYAEYGKRCFEKLKGVWAAVLWDERLKQLVVSRDRLGVRPLYYFSDGQNFLFASEIKSILSLNPNARAINHNRVYDFIHGGRIDDWTGTLFARIQPVPPGTFLRIHTDQVDSTRYWRLRPVTDRNLTAGSVLEKLVVAVERHTPVGIPVALSLSGGIDSSSIAGILARSSKQETRNLCAFSITPPQTTDESFLIDSTIRHTHLRHSYVELNGLDYPRLLSQVIDFHDEPIQYSGVFYQFILRRRMAETGCKAVLVGYGADEIFGGYEYLAVPFLEALLMNGQFAGSLRFATGASHFLQMPASRIFQRTLRNVFVECRAALLRSVKQAFGENRVRRWKGSYSAMAEPLSPLAGRKETEDTPDPFEFSLDGIYRGREFFRALLRCFRTNIPLLVRLEDRNAMAHGLDLCAPFMDDELVETALALPFQQFMEGGRNKAVLRDAVEGLLAKEVSRYPRKLLTPGNDAHLAFEVLRPQFLDMLGSASFYANGLWSRRCAEMYRSDSAQRRRASLWFRVYMLQTWYERVVQMGREFSAGAQR